MSVPSHFPYRPDRQLFRVQREGEDGRTYHIYVLFKFGPDEKTLYLTDMPHQVAP